MKLRIYTFFDRVKVECGSILQYKNDAEALRAYDYAMRQMDANENSVKTSDDILLYCLGEFDSEEGIGEFFDKPLHVVSNVNLED